jgi:hypothetical protein
MADHARARGQSRIEQSFLDRATDADEHADSVMAVLQVSTPSALGDVAEPAVDQNDAA